MTGALGDRTLKEKWGTIFTHIPYFSSTTINPEKGDKLVIMSDGVTDEIHDDELYEICNNHGDKSPAEYLVCSALRRNKYNSDNTTAIVVTFN